MKITDAQPGLRVLVVGDYIGGFKGRIGKIVYVSRSYDDIGVHFDDEAPENSENSDYWFRAEELEMYYMIDELSL